MRWCVLAVDEFFRVQQQVANDAQEIKRLSEWLIVHKRRQVSYCDFLHSPSPAEVGTAGWNVQ